jgi:twitching motility protein PilT
MRDFKEKLEELLQIVAQEGASDLHISSGRPPTIRLHGRLTPLLKYGALDDEEASASNSKEGWARL